MLCRFIFLYYCSERYFSICIIIHSLSFLCRCGPCKVIAPKVDEFSLKYTQAIFLKVNVDQCPVSFLTRNSEFLCWLKHNHYNYNTALTYVQHFHDLNTAGFNGQVAHYAHKPANSNIQKIVGNVISSMIIESTWVAHKWTPV